MLLGDGNGQVAPLRAVEIFNEPLRSRSPVVRLPAFSAQQERQRKPERTASCACPVAGVDMGTVEAVEEVLKVDVATGEAAVAHHQRSDVCAVPAAGVVAEAMVALVLANAALEKFGGDSVKETRRNVSAYLADIADRGLQVRG